MPENKDISYNINNMLNDIPKDFNLLEKQIDVNLQIEYFKKAAKIKKNNNVYDVKQQIKNLFLDNISINDKKDLLIKLAGIPEVDIFRTLEKFLKHADKDIYDWAFLAYTENKLILESSLTKESKVFISTGLGGKGKKLRYFVVLVLSKNEYLTDFRKQFIKDELNFAFEQNDCELEDFSSSENFIKIKTLIPVNADIPKIFKSAINQCNEIDNFLEENFIITNVKELTDNDIINFLER